MNGGQSECDSEGVQAGSRVGGAPGWAGPV